MCKEKKQFYNFILNKNFYKLNCNFIPKLYLTTLTTELTGKNKLEDDNR